MRKLVRSSKKRRPNLFLSHSSKDKTRVRRLASQLNSLGIDVWFDEWELEVGDSLSMSIFAALEKSKYVGLVVTPFFLKSSWCQRELQKSLSREKRQRTKVVMPLLFGKATVPRFVEDRIYLQFGGNYFNALAQLTGMLHGIGRQQIAEVISGKRLGSVTQVARALRQLGWDGTELLDSQDFEELAKLRGVHLRGNIIEFYPDKVRRLNETLSTRSRHLIRK